MCEALEELMKDELEAKRSEGKEEGKTVGKADSVLELLKDLGEVPEKLREKIMGQKNTEVLNRWLKCAAKAESIEEFQKRMK